MRDDSHKGSLRLDNVYYDEHRDPAKEDLPIHQGNNWL